jgi:hypothetical protein
VITGNVRAMLRDEHYRTTMRKWGLEPVVLELLGCCAMLMSEGVPFLLEQRHSHRGPRSWALHIAGDTYHLRPIKTKNGYRMGLKDSYHKGAIVAAWATPAGVQRWFDAQTRRAVRLQNAERVAAAVQDALSGAVANGTGVHA